MKIPKVKFLNLFKKRLSSGVGLAEALAATGLLGVVIIGLVSQQRLSNKSTMNVASENEINSVMKKVITEIGVQSNCSLSENFGGKSPSISTIAQLQRASGAPTVVNTIIAKNSEYGTGAGQVYIDDITSELNTTNHNEMILNIYFRKKEYNRPNDILQKFTTRAVKKVLPLNIVTDSSGNIVSCYGSYDLIVKTAIELSCQGNASYYDSTINPPYGKCVHIEETYTDTTGTTQVAACPDGKFLKIVEGATTTAKVKYKCESLTQACGANYVISGFNTNGTPQCSLAYKECAAGSVLVKNASGQLVCTLINCDDGNLPIKAFSGFNSDGSQRCNQIPGPMTCAGGYATQLNNDGSVTCNTSYVQTSSCGVGTRIQGINADGSALCVPFIKVGVSCPGGQAISGVNVNGDIVCKTINRALACDGTKSSHTYQQCRDAGGTIVYLGTLNSQCRFAGPNCKGGMARCSNYGEQGTQQCTDTSSTYYCDGNRQTRFANAAFGGGYGPADLTTTQCVNWYSASNTNKACYASNNALTYSSQTAVGCY